MYGRFLHVRQLSNKEFSIMARIDSIYQYLGSIPDKRTSIALSKVFERIIPRSTEPVAAGQYANLNNLGNVIELTATRTTVGGPPTCA